MIWCLTRKVLYLICYRILHTLWFGVLQERLCIWFVIRYYIRYDLVSYKKGCVSDLLLDITYVMIWCLTRKVWRYKSGNEKLYIEGQKIYIMADRKGQKITMVEKNTTQNTKRSSNTSPTKNRGRTQVLPGR